MEKLYRAWSTVDDFEGCNGVVIVWYRSVVDSDHRKYPFYELIEDYEYPYAEDFILELLTWEEVQELKEYVAREYGDESLKWSEFNKFPISKHMYPFGGLLSGNGHGHLKIFKDDAYNLSTPISGYYDIRDKRKSLYENLDKKDNSEKNTEPATNGKISCDDVPW